MTMQQKIFFTPEMDAAIIDGRAAGLPWDVIAFRMEVWRGGVLRRADQIGVPRSKTAPALSIEQRHRVVRLRSEGMAYAVIAKLLPCTEWQARKWGKKKSCARSTTS